MRILCSFPGRAGDLLWALPAVRAVSEHFGTPVDLVIAGEFAPMLPLLRAQPYLQHAEAKPTWGLTPPEEWNPQLRPEQTTGYDRVYHLGYRGWPAKPLPFETQDTLATVWDLADGKIPEIDLARPWITYPIIDRGLLREAEIAVGFTEAWFELKLGVLTAFARRPIAGAPYWQLLTPEGSRWTTEAYEEGCSWGEAAEVIQCAKVFLGDCSALHVLAVALGKPCVILEPMEARWNPLFYPLGTHGRVRLVRGLDGLPSFDARHCAETLEAVLHGR